MADTASRKWLLTINNPQEHGWSHDRIKEVLSSFKTMTYWCMADEIGAGEHTPHTHIFINLSPSNCRFSTLKNKFPDAHIDKCKGTSTENRDYILKAGKWKDTEKGTTSLPDTFEENGTCPNETPGKSKSVERIVEMVKDGCSNLEILDSVPYAMQCMDKIDRTRSLLRDQRFITEWRNLDVTYIFGRSGSGKTRSVMEKYGYTNCYRVTDYSHPFDTYDGQDVLIFEEFRSGLRHGDMLNYLDGYPLLLPCRYFNRQACYTKVYIISNIGPEEQYKNIDEESRHAFYRRINRVVHFNNYGPVTYNGMKDYLDRLDWVTAAERAPVLPW